MKSEDINTLSKNSLPSIVKRGVHNSMAIASTIAKRNPVLGLVTDVVVANDVQVFLHEHEKKKMAHRGRGKDEEVDGHDLRSSVG
jgi:hypothetical protein